MDKKRYITADFYMVRTPIIESSRYTSLFNSFKYGEVDEVDKAYFIDILKNDVVRESIAIASLDWKGNPFLDKFIPNKNILSKYCLSY